MLDPSAGLRRQSLPKSRQIGGWDGPGCCGGFHSLQFFGHEFSRSPTNDDVFFFFQAAGARILE